MTAKKSALYFTSSNFLLFKCSFGEYKILQKLFLNATDPKHLNGIL